MTTAILTALVLCIIAGFINGSFATPTKWMTKWKEENIWLGFGLFGYFILPLVTILVLAPNIFSDISLVSSNYIWILILGGLAWGIGQVFFALAFRMIGLGINFVINIAFGTAGGALIPLLWHRGLIGTTYSYLQLLGVIIFIVAVILGATAGAARIKAKKENTKREEHGSKHTLLLVLGIIFAILAGLGSMAQGSSFAFSNPQLLSAATGHGASALASGTISFVIVFLAAGVPNVIFFLVKNIQNKSLSKFSTPGTGKYWFYLVLMAIGAWGSVVLFCKANLVIGGDLAVTIAWPLFMVFIILTANFWSFVSGEWKNAGGKAVKMISTSIALFVVAVIVFAASSSIKPKDNVTTAKTVATHSTTVKHVG